MSETFLDSKEVSELTGRRARALQIEALRKMMLPFWVNALGRPIVPRTAIDGKANVSAKPPKKQWEPPE